MVLAYVFLSLSAHARESLPGSGTVMDAHNCFPYFEWWYDRIDRALSAGTPLAIEQDRHVKIHRDEGETSSSRKNGMSNLQPPAKGRGAYGQEWIGAAYVAAVVCGLSSRTAFASFPPAPGLIL